MATLVQGDTAIRGDRIVLDQQKGDLVASGSARSTLMLDTGRTDGRANEIRYDEAARTVTYSAGAVAPTSGQGPSVPLAQVTGPDGDLRAERVEIVLARTENGVDRLEAYNRVTTVIGARTGTGDRMTYHAREERYVLSGAGVTPVSIREKCSETTGRTLTFFKSSDRIIVDGNERRRTETKPCTQQPAAESAAAIAAPRDDVYAADERADQVVWRPHRRARRQHRGGSGEIVGLLGPNGAGKTTTFYMTVGLTGAGLRACAPRWRGCHRRPDVCARPQGNRIPAAGALDLPRTLGRAEHHGDSRDASARSRRAERRGCEDLLAELHLTPLRSAPAHTLSGGERRRAEITRALVMSPRFILLDEPFAGIDPIAVSDIQNIVFHLKERGIGVLITDHNVRETLRITDRAYIVHDGAIFRSGTPESLAADEDVRRIYLGTEFRLD